MDGLFNLCGNREQVFTHDGKTYTFSVRVLSNFAAFESYMLRRTISPYKGIEGLPRDLQQVAVAAAAQEAARPKIVTMQDADNFGRTWPGLGYKIWQALQKHHPSEFPPSLPAEQGAQLGMDFLEWAGGDRTSEIVRIVEKVDENDILGNSAGPLETEAA